MSVRYLRYREDGSASWVQPNEDLSKASHVMLEKQEYDLIRNEVVQLREELEKKSRLNEVLLKINKDRSNAEHELRPKKTHTGFVVLASPMYEIHYRNYSESKTAAVRKTVIQTPYSTEFPIEQATQLANRFYEADENGQSLANRIGIDCFVDEPYPRLMAEIEMNRLDSSKNYAFQQWLNPNYKTRLWELVVFHIKPLPPVPEEMMPQLVGKKKQVSSTSEKED